MLAPPGAACAFCARHGRIVCLVNACRPVAQTDRRSLSVCLRRRPLEIAIILHACTPALLKLHRPIHDRTPRSGPCQRSHELVWAAEQKKELKQQAAYICTTSNMHDACTLVTSRHQSLVTADWYQAYQ
jgi:hypothetical protein